MRVSGVTWQQLPRPHIMFQTWTLRTFQRAVTQGVHVPFKVTQWDAHVQQVPRPQLQLRRQRTGLWEACPRSRSKFLSLSFPMLITLSPMASLSYHQVWNQRFPMVKFSPKDSFRHTHEICFWTVPPLYFCFLSDSWLEIESNSAGSRDVNKFSFLRCSSTKGTKKWCGGTWTPSRCEAIATSGQRKAKSVFRSPVRSGAVKETQPDRSCCSGGYFTFQKMWPRAERKKYPGFSFLLPFSLLLVLPWTKPNQKPPRRELQKIEWAEASLLDTEQHRKGEGWSWEGQETVHSLYLVSNSAFVKNETLWKVTNQIFSDSIFY